MIREYNKEYFNYLKENIIEFSIDYLNNPNIYEKNYVYLDKNMPIGLISFSIIYDRVELDYIWVKKEHRNKLIASTLLEYMFKTSNVKSYSLEVAIDNINAIKLYKKYDFNIVSIRKKYYNNKDAYLMVKEVR